MLEYANIFQNKTVALVASAKYLDRFRFGSDIDSHDIVVRVNKGIDVLNNDTSYKYGSRADVLYHCMLEDPPESNGPKFGFIDVNKWIEKGVKNIFCLPESDMKGSCRGNFLSPAVNTESIKRVKKSAISLEIVDFQLYNQLSEYTRCKPNTGIVALYHILSANPKKLSTYGFSFLLDGWVKEYREGIQNLQESIDKNWNTIEEWEIRCLNSKRHIQKNQWKFVKSVNNQYSIFSPDPYMEKILLMSDFKKENLVEFNV